MVVVCVCVCLCVHARAPACSLWSLGDSGRWRPHFRVSASVKAFGRTTYWLLSNCLKMTHVTSAHISKASDIAKSNFKRGRNMQSLPQVYMEYLWRALLNTTTLETLIHSVFPDHTTNVDPEASDLSRWSLEEPSSCGWSPFPHLLKRHHTRWVQDCMQQTSSPRNHF